MADKDFLFGGDPAEPVSDTDPFGGVLITRLYDPIRPGIAGTVPTEDTTVATEKQKKTTGKADKDAADRPRLADGSPAPRDPRFDPANDMTAPPPVEVNLAIGDDEIDDHTGAADDRDAAFTALDAAGRQQKVGETLDERGERVEAIQDAKDLRKEAIHADADAAQKFRDLASLARGKAEAAATDAPSTGSGQADDEPEPKRDKEAATIDEAIAEWNALSPKQRAKRSASGKQRVIEDGGRRFDAHTCTYLD